MSIDPDAQTKLGSTAMSRSPLLCRVYAKLVSLEDTRIRSVQRVCGVYCSEGKSVTLYIGRYLGNRST